MQPMHSWIWIQEMNKSWIWKAVGKNSTWNDNTDETMELAMVVENLHHDEHSVLWLAGERITSFCLFINLFSPFPKTHANPFSKSS